MVFGSRGAWPASRRACRAYLVGLFSLVCLVCIDCGKKGPPLPPLVRLPLPPAEFSAERRGATVDFDFSVPAANTDNSRPANVARVDVYGLTSREPVTAAQIVKRGTRVGSVAVKAPRDPNDTIDEDEPAADMPQPEGKGLDQGARAHLSEVLERAALEPVQAPADRRKRPATSTAATGPLLPPRGVPLTRTYIAVGVSTRERLGPYSKPVTIPILPPPPAPGKPSMTYDEKAITVKWDPIPMPPPIQRPPAGGELASTAIGGGAVTVRYNLYEVQGTAQAGAPQGGVAQAGAAPAKLTRAALDEPMYADARVVWGEERCYAVRVVEIVSDLTIESVAGPTACTTPKDTFPPAPPANLLSSPLEGAITLIWEPSPEKDLDGYIVLRGESPETLKPITDAPIQATTYRDDHAASGVRFVYAVKAVDKAGNVSGLSNAVEETAR
jgi:hypothetical protein